ncbi:MAG: bifunctional hydroxymethylpyrimidine kinase/phosphomethylpyrimidine kinase [Firmicutes bacterium]|jgi:hydroxymethylpyrimidine/phosphomethylpyrimidine kinase|nr:bifunctional hydroxymethylpyrimidine kinase/phosphomethylpyrimidine kinase [Bacillota bacterium]MDH7495312.1 bifunctional hydroxymethylpyrimidine kinase/phosphomethylpyrimidine kinase [Bacillota bacterium]
MVRISKYVAPNFERTEPDTVPVALTIAGSDSGGGAGIEADLKTFTSLGVFGAVALTAVTAQNTLGVPGVSVLDPGFVVAQLDAVLMDLQVGAAKTGMLATAAIIEAVADSIRRHSVRKLVVDPVMVSKTGVPLLSPDARDALVRRLLPLATVLTPNIPEAEAILGVAIKSSSEARLAAQRLKDMGPEWVVVKGGHLREQPGDSVDIAFNGEEFIELRAKRYATANTHGTGCTYSAAIAAYLALGMKVQEALRAAKDYITWAVANSLSLGHGCGPTNHFYFRR